LGRNKPKISTKRVRKVTIDNKVSRTSIKAVENDKKEGDNIFREKLKSLTHEN